MKSEQKHSTISYSDFKQSFFRIKDFDLDSIPVVLSIPEGDGLLLDVPEGSKPLIAPIYFNDDYTLPCFLIDTSGDDKEYVMPVSELENMCADVDETLKRLGGNVITPDNLHMMVYLNGKLYGPYKSQIVELTETHELEYWIDCIELGSFEKVDIGENSIALTRCI